MANTEQYAQADVGRLMSLINFGPVSELPKIQQAGILTGHSGILDELEHRTGKKIGAADIKKALENSVQFRGLTIHDARTSTGDLYQRLHGSDFDSLGIIVELEDGRSGRFAYCDIVDNAEFTDAVGLTHTRYADEITLANWALLRHKGYDAKQPVFDNGYKPAGIEFVSFGGTLLRWDNTSAKVEYPFGIVTVEKDGQDVVVKYAGENNEGKGTYEMHRFECGKIDYSRLGPLSDKQNEVEFILSKI